MVANTGTADGPDQLRVLNRPRPVQVRTGEGGEPREVQLRGRWQAVEEVLDQWLLGPDEWWRPTPIHRAYYEVLLEGGARVILFQDLENGEWHNQRA